MAAHDARRWGPPGELPRDGGVEVLSDLDGDSDAASSYGGGASSVDVRREGWDMDPGSRGGI